MTDYSDPFATPPDLPENHAGIVPAEERSEMLAELRRRNDLKQVEVDVRKRSSKLQVWTIVGVLLLFVLNSIALGLMWARFQILISDQEARSGVNTELLEIIETQTSPAAQARQDEQLQTIFAIVDCDNREALQELVDNLAEQGIVNRFELICRSGP